MTQLSILSQNLTELNEDKVDRYSDTTYSEVKGLGYDATNKKLGLIVEEGGADTLVPFSSGGCPFMLYRNDGYYNDYVAYINTDGEFEYNSYYTTSGSTPQNCALGTFSWHSGYHECYFTFRESGTYWVNGTQSTYTAGQTITIKSSTFYPVIKIA